MIVTKYYFQFLLGLAMFSFLVVGCAPASLSADVEGSELSRLAEEPADSAPITANTGASEPATIDVEAELTVVAGSIMLKRSDETEFQAVEGTESLAVGDFVRTGSDGVATITFADNTEATLFPNTQVRIKNLEQQDSGALIIVLQQYIGRAFHRANFTADGSSYDVESTNGTARVEGTAFYVEVLLMLLEGKSPEEIADFIEDNEFFQAAIGDNLDALRELDEIHFIVDVAGGRVIIGYLDENGEPQTGTLDAGQLVTIIRHGADAWEDFDSDTNFLTGLLTDVFFGISERACGDGVCDPYLGETTATCSADCSQ